MNINTGLVTTDQAFPPAQQEIQRITNEILMGYLRSGQINQNIVLMTMNYVNQQLYQIEAVIKQQCGGGTRYDGNVVSAVVTAVVNQYVKALLQQMQPAANMFQQGAGMGMGFGMPSAGFGMPAFGGMAAPVFGNVQAGGLFGGMPAAPAPFGGVPVGAGGTVFAAPAAQTQQPAARQAVQPPATISEVPVMPVTEQPFNAPTQIEVPPVDTSRAGDAQLSGLTVWRESGGSRELDMVRMHLNAGQTDEYEVARHALDHFKRACRVHPCYFFQVAYNKLTLIRESPTKIQNLLQTLSQAVNCTPNAAQAFDNLLVSLDNAPAGLSKIVSSWLLTFLNESLRNAIWAPGPQNTQDNLVVWDITLFELTDLRELIDPAKQNEEIRKLASRRETGYAAYIENLIGAVVNKVKGVSLCNPQDPKDICDILTAYNGLEIEGVSSSAMLRSMLQRRGDTTTEAEKENEQKFLSRYAVLREPAMLAFTNIVPLRLIDRIPQLSESLNVDGDLRNVHVRFKTPTDLVEWALHYDKISAPVLIMPGTAGYTRLYSQISADGVVVLFPSPK